MSDYDKNEEETKRLQAEQIAEAARKESEQFSFPCSFRTIKFPTNVDPDTELVFALQELRRVHLLIGGNDEGFRHTLTYFATKPCAQPSTK